MDITAKAAYLATSDATSRLAEPVPKIKIKKALKSTYLAVNSYVALPVKSTSSEFDTTSDLSVYDPSGTEIGLLTFTTSISSFNLASLTDAQLVAYLTEIDLTTTRIGDDYKFLNNYLVIKGTHLITYLKNHYNTAPLWGRFSHTGFTGGIHMSHVTQINIQAIDYSKSVKAADILNQAVAQPFSAERFLRLYHVLETDFDYIMVSKLRDLNLTTDSHKMGEIINEFNKTDYERLKHLLFSRITNFTELMVKLDKSLTYQSKAEIIFYNFGKPTNPLKDINAFKQICIRGGFNQSNMESLEKKYKDIKVYEAFLIQLTTYWVYRVRCCIAHNKIGEYMLQPGDEEFIVEFAEPLLRSVLIQYLG